MSEHTAEILRKFAETEWDAGFDFLATMMDIPDQAQLDELKKYNPHRRNNEN